MERFGASVPISGRRSRNIFGYPVAHEKCGARRAGGPEFLHRLTKSGQNVRDGSDFPLTARIGIHTGLVLIGPELLSGGAEFSAIGEAVNLAARLQAEASPGGRSSVGDRSAQQGRFTFEDLGPRAIKGLTRKIGIYKIAAPFRRARGPGHCQPA